MGGNQGTEASFEGGELPRVFGEYVLLEHLAQGGMGNVFLAKTAGGAMGIERPCVLKALRSELTSDQGYVTRFIDEARLVVQLNHPNICHVFDVGRVADQYYVAMEYIEGWTLAPFMEALAATQMPIPMEIMLHIVAEAVTALNYAHGLQDGRGQALELVHRDVSPHNIMIGADGSVKLVDFGIASSRMKVERTAPRVVLGKMAYMSPEQARGEKLDRRADLFAAGVLLYELTAGERFYQGMTTEQIWSVVGRGGFRPRLFAALPQDLRAVLDRALAEDVEKRFASGSDFEDALRSLLFARESVIGAIQVRNLVEELFDPADADKTEILEASIAEFTSAGIEVTAPQAASAPVHFARAAGARAAVTRAAVTDEIPIAKVAGLQVAASDAMTHEMPATSLSSPPSPSSSDELAARVQVPASLPRGAGAQKTEVIDRQQLSPSAARQSTPQASSSQMPHRRGKSGSGRILLLGSAATLVLLALLFGTVVLLRKPATSDKRSSLAPRAAAEMSTPLAVGEGDQ